MKMRSTTPMRVSKIGYVIMSVVFCVVGILFMVWSDVSTVALGYALGGAMIVFGIIKMVGYFSKDLFRLAFQYDLELGIVLTVLGIIVLAKPFDVMNFIFIAMGIAILTDSLFKARIAYDAKRFGITVWWMILALAIISGVIGVMLTIRPWESARMLTVLLGISLLSDGVLNLCVAISTVKIIKNQYPDVIEADYCEMEDETK